MGINPWALPFSCLKSNNTAKNKNITTIIASGVAIMMFMVVLFAPEIIYLMAGENYMGAIWVVPPVAISVLLQYYTALFTNVEFWFIVEL